MHINIYVIVVVSAAILCLIGWLVYSNMKDEKKFESDLDAKDELPPDIKG